MLHRQSLVLLSIVTCFLLTACGQKGELYLANKTSLAKNDNFLVNKYAKKTLSPQNKTENGSSEINKHLETDQQLQQNIKKMQNDPNDY